MSAFNPKEAERLRKLEEWHNSPEGKGYGKTSLEAIKRKYHSMFAGESTPDSYGPVDYGAMWFLMREIERKSEEVNALNERLKSASLMVILLSSVIYIMSALIFWPR